VFSGEPDSWSDQLIMNIEALYTPDRIFTDPSLDRDFLEKNELVAALVLEKYQRFTPKLPAMYLVGQVLHKTQSDIFGRHLGGYGGTTSHEARGKDSGYTALAFAVQSWAQQYTTPTHTALIFALEPVFAWATSFVVSWYIAWSRSAALAFSPCAMRRRGVIQP
jgi:hypothetical protein